MDKGDDQGGGKDGVKKAGAGKRPPAPPRTRRPSPAAGRPRGRGGEARAIADVMPAVNDAVFRKFGFIQATLVTRWPDIVGAQLARLCRPESLRFAAGAKRDGTLRLSVAGAAAPLLQHASADIIERVNRFFGFAAVKRVQLLQGGVMPAVEARRPRPAAPPPLPPQVLGESLKGIADPELRAVLEGLGAALVQRDGLPKIS